MKIIALKIFYFLFISASSLAFADIKITLKKANIIGHDKETIRIVSEGRLFILDKKNTFLEIEKVCNNEIEIFDSSLIKIKKATKKQMSLKCQKRRNSND